MHTFERQRFISTLYIAKLIEFTTSIENKHKHYNGPDYITVPPHVNILKTKICSKINKNRPILK